MLNEWLVSTFGLEQPPINLLYTFWIILLAHAFYNATVVVRIVGGFWSNLDPRLGEAAAVLGVPCWRRSVEITLPLLMPSIIAAALLVFLFCFTSFGVILILGGPRFATLEVETYRQAVNYFNLPLAAALALVQLGLTFIVMIVYTRLQARASLPLNLRPQSLTARRPATWRVVRRRPGQYDPGRRPVDPADCARGPLGHARRGSADVALLSSLDRKPQPKHLFCASGRGHSQLAAFFVRRGCFLPSRWG